MIINNLVFYPSNKTNLNLLVGGREGLGRSVVLLLP